MVGLVDLVNEQSPPSSQYGDGILSGDEAAERELEEGEISEDIFLEEEHGTCTMCGHPCSAAEQMCKTCKGRFYRTFPVPPLVEGL